VCFSVQELGEAEVLELALGALDPIHQSMRTVGERHCCGLLSVYRQVTTDRDVAVELGRKQLPAGHQPDSNLQEHVVFFCARQG